MDFAPTPRAAELATQVRVFVDERIVPVEHEVALDIAQRRARGEDAWPPHPVIAQLQSQARAEGLWNLFLPAGHEGPYAQRYGTSGGRGLSNSEFDGPHDRIRFGSAEDITAAFNGFRPFGHIAQCDIRNAKDGTLLLDRAAVGEYSKRIFLEFYKIEEAEGVEQTHSG